MNMFGRILAALIIVAMAGCDYKSTGTENGQSFAAANGPVEFQFPAGWFQTPEKHPYDLQ
jgi:uncharacterized lipoprotein